MKTLILGMGNTLLRDDGIGIIVKRYLELKLHDVKDIDFVETSWGGFKIVDLLTGYDYAIIVDSIKTSHKPLGHIHYLKPSALLPTLRLTSYHDINFITALKLAETIHAKVPDDIDIFAVEVENNYTISEQLSPELWKTITKCSYEIATRLADKGLVPDILNKYKFDENMSLNEIKALYDEQYFEENISLQNTLITT
jgi:hydrogenase maturation protease